MGGVDLFDSIMDIYNIWLQNNGICASFIITWILQKPKHGYFKKGLLNKKKFQKSGHLASADFCMKVQKNQKETSTV